MLGIKVQRATCDNVFILSFLQEDKSFNNGDISIAENEGINLTYVKRLYPELSNGFRAEEAEVLATNDNYVYFTGLELMEGTFFNRMQAEKELSVVVLNETAAYQFFGNYDCIGESIYLEQNAFEVIGIVKEHGNEAIAKIYIPDETAEALNMSRSEANQLWCRFTNVAEAALVLKKMGYSMEEIDILQVDLFKTVFMQRVLVLLILAGTFLFIHIFKALLHKVKGLRQMCISIFAKKWLETMQGYSAKYREIDHSIMLVMGLTFCCQMMTELVPVSDDSTYALPLLWIGMCTVA